MAATRRKVIAALPAGFALVALGLAGPGQAATTGPLRVIAWQGYEDKAFYGDFLRRYATPPQFEPMVAEGQALARLRAGYAADLVQPCAWDLDMWIDGGVLRPIETARLRHWGDVWRPLRKLAPGPGDGKVWMVPFDWGPASVIYRTDMVERAPASWSVLFDERYGGRLSMERSPEAAVSCAALAAGVRNPWSMSDDDKDRVADLLIRQRGLVRMLWSRPEEVEAGLESGDLVAAYGWNDIYARLAARGVPVAFMAPREGFISWVCGIARLSSGRADEEMAHAFVDAMLAPEAGAELIARYGYGHANRNAFGLVPADILDRLALAEAGGVLSGSVLLVASRPRAVRPVRRSMRGRWRPPERADRWARGRIVTKNWSRCLTTCLRACTRRRRLILGRWQRLLSSESCGVVRELNLVALETTGFSSDLPLCMTDATDDWLGVRTEGHADQWLEATYPGMDDDRTSS